MNSHDYFLGACNKENVYATEMYGWEDLFSHSLVVAINIRGQPRQQDNAQTPYDITVKYVF
jgi:hypothetical protein